MWFPGNSDPSSGCGLPNLLTANVLYLGKAKYLCEFCWAMFWFNEWVKRNRSTIVRFNRCYRGGIIRLPPIPPTPPLLYYLLSSHTTSVGTLFQQNIMTYNSMFAFTSIGAKIDKVINDGRCPYCFRIHGQNYHYLGSLLLPDGVSPSICSAICIWYDTQHELSNRFHELNVKDDPTIDATIVTELVRSATLTGAQFALKMINYQNHGTS